MQHAMRWKDNLAHRNIPVVADINKAMETDGCE
jgi:hypothetical protein